MIQGSPRQRGQGSISPFIRGGRTLRKREGGRGAVRYLGCVLAFLHPAQAPECMCAYATEFEVKCRGVLGFSPMASLPQEPLPPGIIHAVTWLGRGRADFGFSESLLPPMWVEGIWMSCLVLRRVRKAGDLTRNVAAAGVRGSWNQRLQSGPLGLGTKAPSQEGLRKSRAGAGVAKSARRAAEPQGSRAKRVGVRCGCQQGESNQVQKIHPYIQGLQGPGEHLLKKPSTAESFSER